MNKKKVYLGDSVYGNMEGRVLVLTTENGFPDDPSNTICIEPEVWEALVKYMERNEK